MPRLWKKVDGEPYMINPRLGILALNPKRRKRGKKNMARKYGARHMAWVRSFRKKNRRRRRKHNAYPLAGTAVGMANPHRRRHHRKHNRRHHRKHNPGLSLAGTTRSIGLPAWKPVAYGALGFVGTAAIQGFADTLVPTSMKTNTDGTPSLLVKYGEIAVGIIGSSYLAKTFIGDGAGPMAGIGGGIYATTQLVHDFLPNMIPGMHAYTPLKSYTPLRRSGGMGMYIPSAGGAMPQLATRYGMPQLAAPDFGAMRTANFADDGAMHTVSQRFRRFQ